MNAPSLDCSWFIYRYLHSFLVIMSSSHLLPDDFLSGPAPNPTAARIDFANTTLPEYAGMYAVVLDGMLTGDECRALVSAAEAQANGTWERALVNIGSGQQAMYEDTRKSGRIIWDNQDVVQKIWSRCEGLLPELHELRSWHNVTGQRLGVKWALTRLNERMRFLKYTSGEYFKRELSSSLTLNKTDE
jgi:hypothetical protein